jgi:hypothetical protein
MASKLDIESMVLYLLHMECSPNRYSKRSLLLALLCLLLSLIVGIARREGLVPPSLRWAAALLPVLPMVGYFVGLGQWLKTMDELQRLIQLEALLIQFGLTGIVVMAYGLLAKFEVVPNTGIADSWPWLWLLLFLGWSVGQLIVRRKYR